MKKYIILLISIVFFSCEQQELPIAPHNSGEIKIQQIDMSSDYRYQVFYDLGTSSSISQNLKVSWDLQFESSVDGFHILLNSSTFSALSYIDNLSFSDTITTSNLIWNWDNPNGNLDSSAFGDYRLKSGFFVVDRGYNVNASLRGFKKMKIDTVTNEFYQITYANLDNSDFNSLKIYKDPVVAFTSFSFVQNDIVNIQPPIDDWDLIFTQYTHLFNDPNTPAYLVTGVLNNLDIMVARDTSYDFSEISYDMISSFSFATESDIIGYDWKNYSHSSGSFTINSNINYIIKDRQQKYFKLRFIDYYNDAGDKGYPKFEMQEL